MGKVTMPGLFAVKTPAFHLELEQDYLDYTQTFTCIIAPRGHAKSSIVSCVFAIHHAFCAWPDLLGATPFVLIQSKTGPHAERLLQSIKDVLTYSESFRAVFGYHGRENARKWREDVVILDTGAIIMSKGMGQQMVGVKIGNQRPTFIISDDPEDMENTKTPAAIKYNMAWFLQSLVPSRDPRVGRVFVIGTPQAESCIVETLSQSTTWKSRRYQAMTDELEQDLELQEKLLRGEVESRSEWVLWHEWMPAHKLVHEKKMMEENFGVSAFFREYQCKLVGGEDSLVGPSDIRYYDGALKTDRLMRPYMEFTEGGEVVNRRRVNVFMGMDFATSTGRHADYTVIMAVAVDADYNRYILPFARGRYVPSITLARASLMWTEIRPLLLNIETSGQQETFAEMITAKAREDGMFDMTIVPHKPRDSKEKRYLDGLEPLFKRGKIHLQRDMGTLESELFLWRPGDHRGHDDMLDALYYANRGVFAPSDDYIALEGSQVEQVRNSRLDPMIR